MWKQAWLLMAEGTEGTKFLDMRFVMGEFFLEVYFDGGKNFEQPKKLKGPFRASQLGPNPSPSERKFWEVCFVVGENFWTPKFSFQNPIRGQRGAEVFQSIFWSISKHNSWHDIKLFPEYCPLCAINLRSFTNYLKKM